MKTLRIFIVLCFFAAFAVNNVKAQPPVIKSELTVWEGPTYFPCTGDYLFGYVTFKSMLMSHNWLVFTEVLEFKGYKDEAMTEPSGNTYELQGIEPGLAFAEHTIIIKMNGKLVAAAHFSYHITTNANGDITQEHLVWRWGCKD